MILTPATGAAEVEANAGARRPAPDPAWVAEADETARIIRDAVVRGAKEGKKARIFIEFGGASRRATVVSASEEGLGVSVGGARMPVPWAKLKPARIYYLSRAYLPADDARTRLRLARYCAVHGLVKEAREEVQSALRKDAGLRDEAGRVTAFLRESERARSAAHPSRPSGSTRRDGARKSAPAEKGKLDRAARRLGPDWAHFHKEREEGGVEVFQRHATGVYT